VSVCTAVVSSTAVDTACLLTPHSDSATGCLLVAAWLLCWSGSVGGFQKQWRLAVLPILILIPMGPFTHG
jgi:hypothetical protein